MRLSFPQTQYTWIDNRLGAGDSGRKEILDHIMAVYGEPLARYAEVSRKLVCDDPRELVHEFIVDGLQMPEYVERWRSSSITLLRVWLINGLHFQHRKLKRKSGADREALQFLWDEETCWSRIEPEPFEVLQGAWRDRLFSLALEKAQTRCTENGQGEAWSYFEAHRIRGERWVDIGRRVGAAGRTVEVRARAGLASFKRELFTLLEREGIPQGRAIEFLEVY